MSRPSQNTSTWVRLLRMKAELDASADQRRIDRIPIASQRHGCGGRQPPQHRPAECLAQEGRLDWLQRTLTGESVDRRPRNC
jgi:hypothetical protein